MSCAGWYRWFGEHDARGRSPSYARLAVAVADDVELCGRIDRLPPAKQQPNLLFAATRVLGGPTESWPAFRTFVDEHWTQVGELMASRSTQTNEPARCASLLPVLAALPQPLALIELGASAGLCLFPDRYQYRYDDITVGSSPVSVDVECCGPVPVPTELPTVVWRAGVDLEPRDVMVPEDLDWLRACIWPEQIERHRRFEAAVAIASEEPPTLVQGDLVDRLPELLDAAPAGATKVVQHSVVLFYLEHERRRALATMLDGRDDVVWVSMEGPGHVPGIATDARPPQSQNQQSYMVIGVGGRGAVGLAGPHGSWLSWF